MYIFPKSDYSKSVSKPYSEGGIELPKITKADLKKLMSLKSTINKKKELKKAFSRKTQDKQLEVEEKFKKRQIKLFNCFQAFQ